MDRERLYTMDNSAILGAFDLKSGAELWTKTLGTLQKGSPVLADGKLYVGTENGKFYILKPSPTAVEVLDEDWLGSEQTPEPVYGSPAVSGGRVFVTSMEAPYGGHPTPVPRECERGSPLQHRTRVAIDPERAGLAVSPRG